MIKSKNGTGIFFFRFLPSPPARKMPVPFYTRPRCKKLELTSISVLYCLIMHQIPSDANFSTLIGKTVSQVCISTHQLIIRMEEDLFINLECAYSFPILGKNGDQGEYPNAAHEFTALLDRSILTIEREDEKPLAIKFTDNYILNIYDSNDHYESFQINTANGLVVV